MFKRKRYYGKHRYPPWFWKIRNGFKQLLLPLFIFQLIRTLVFPTSLDVMLVILLLLLYLFLSLDWI
ncbi:hypothetical protein [Bacillus taeanensis]|uniref:Uncharacterized protein n=1 Tax=Bacillus taeanensis TaxID=273032 RepID=A0A366Y5U5_9BACI|nr:hypothetical protein [Bacillus taeanensis]RBW71581.1 hypothetical protein DS031_02200 [Bacillus taeanensis]